ncbi:DUF6233 domain-containing protein [Streptomyces sp. NPDC057301]|uniref:DUF6233 domain-containing protein n=1 Tax=Streptomyces sp. NPDC057301 TaxID=3346093 RepID=UPI0036348B38
MTCRLTWSACTPCGSGTPYGWNASTTRSLLFRSGRQNRNTAGAAGPQPPDWIVELGIGADRTPVQVHAGNCHVAGKRRREVSRDEARRLLAAGLPGCTHCEPDVRLRMDDLESPAPTARRRRPLTTPADPPGSRLRTFVSSGGYPATEVTGARHPEQDPRCRLPHPRSANRARPH